MFNSDLSRDYLISDSDCAGVYMAEDGEIYSRGYEPRDWEKFRAGSLEFTRSFDPAMLIPESEWRDRIERQERTGSRLSDIRNIGDNRIENDPRPMPSSDQDGIPYCADEDTEVLTTGGWVRWGEYNWRDPLATVNQHTHAMEFQPPLAKHVFSYDGPMVYSDNSRLDFAVTPNHRMFVRKWDERRRTLSPHYSFQLASDLGWYVGLMHAPRGWRGTELNVVSIDGDRQYQGEDFLALLSLIISDGYVGGNSHVSFCCFHKGRYRYVQELAAKVGFAEQPSRRGVFHRHSAPALNAWLRANCYAGNEYRSPNKRIPEIVKCVSASQIRHFLAWYGDQNHSRKPERYFSSSKRLVDDLQELLLRVGRRSTVYDRPPSEAVMLNGHVIRAQQAYGLGVSNTSRLCLDRKKHVRDDRYKGLVYCATVPNGTLITRRNDSVLISGNCWIHGCCNAMRLCRAKDGLKYVELEPTMAGSIIKNYRKVGGNTPEALRHLREVGVCTTDYWPKNVVRKPEDEAMRKALADAKNYRILEWYELERGNFEQMASLLLRRIPVACGFSHWGHLVVACDLVVSGSQWGIRIWNSWADRWGEQGMGLLMGRKAVSFDQMAPAATSWENFA